MASRRRDAALKGWDTRRLNLSGCGHPWRLQTLERTGYIYVLTNLVSGKQYTGQALDAEARWAGHISAALEKNSQYPIHRAIRKYGVKKFSAEVQMRWNRTPKAEKEAYGKRLFRLQNQ